MTLLGVKAYNLASKELTQRGFALHETDLSAQVYTQEAGTRLPEANEHQERPPGPQDEETPRAQEVDGRIDARLARVRSAHLFMQRCHRLKKGADFQRVRALKQSWAHPLLVLYAAPNDLDVTRIGISVSKRIGNAVARNRAKRRIREAVRPLLPNLPRGRDLVFIARAAVADADFQQLSHAVEALLRRARLQPSPRPSPDTEGVRR